MPNVPNTQPAIMKPTEEHPAYTQITKEHALAQAELLKRQEELERKAAELDRREREMQSLSQHGLFSVGSVVSIHRYRHTEINTQMAESIAFAYLLCPAQVDSFITRSDSSFRFFVFFFVYICQFAVHVLQAAGFHNWGNCGWISSLTGLNKNIPVGIMMIIIAALFTASAVISLVMFKKDLMGLGYMPVLGSMVHMMSSLVHGLYRTTGASFEKAQQEFATGVMSNKTVQTAAANAASTAATSAAQNAFKGNQM
ncbi:hypothetical protein U0070_022306 [Myodes glareolus]|uniref:Secretory carrier-associated membrane protein n=1 Tax=Myodes glareolus TaxID=447135 RepID=A0AAW0IBZ6_MYOGA